MVDERPTRILTINSGSSSLKFAIFHMERTEARVMSGRMERIGLRAGVFQVTGVFQVKGPHGATLLERSLDLPDHDTALTTLLQWLREQSSAQNLDAVGHRLVHGGKDYTQPQRITSALVASLQNVIPLAPDHLPHELKAVETISRHYPELTQVACFDTFFHRHMPRLAQMYGLPRQLEQEGVRRYGFHGLSYEYLMHELRTVAGPREADGRVIIAHLGNGASMAAMRQGTSIETTMGFTPTGGLLMSTRSGDLDPGVILYLLRERDQSTGDVEELVSQRAGLLGVSGQSSDMKDLLAREAEDSRAAEAIALFCYQAKKFLAALVAVLGGLDTLIFTAGIGESAPAIRWRICEDLGFLGIQIDSQRNDANAPVISTDGGPVTVRVMKTDEELMIAKHTNTLIHQDARQPQDETR